MCAEKLKNMRESNLIEWYNEVVLNAEVADFSEAKGFTVYRPYGYAMWEVLEEYLDVKFKAKGVKNTYFPLLIPEYLLKKEASHIKGFAPEVAWVTKGGDRDLDVKLAVRPTSETIMYDSYSRWVKSYRDLPILLNQWNTVVRWETKETRLFLRGREVLWQEGHCAFADNKSAEENTLDMLNIYKGAMEELLAVPVLVGRKSEAEKFAGAVATYTVETVLSNNFASQAATSHNLGQNFSKAFEIKFIDNNNQWNYVYQTSWGMSMRALGIMFLVHGDNKGLILPPRIAPIQVVAIPILNGKDDKMILKYANDVVSAIKSDGIRCELDSREGYTPGWKFNEYELKGVPIRLEIGIKEASAAKVSVKKRNEKEKTTLELKNIKMLKVALDEMQANMLKEARKSMESRIIIEKDTKNVISILKSAGAIVKTSWCGTEKCEETIKEKTGATSRVIPLENEKLISDKCTFCGDDAKYNAYFGQSY